MTLRDVAYICYSKAKAQHIPFFHCYQLCRLSPHFVHQHYVSYTGVIAHACPSDSILASHGLYSNHIPLDIIQEASNELLDLVLLLRNHFGAQHGQLLKSLGIRSQLSPCHGKSNISSNGSLVYIPPSQCTVQQGARSILNLVPLETVADVKYCLQLLKPPGQPDNSFGSFEVEWLTLHEIMVNELSKVMGNVLIPKNEVKGVTTRREKMTSEATPSKEINETRINKNEPLRFEQDVMEKPHDDGVENKSSSISKNTAQSSVKP
ncbi:hypothetical protein Tco_0682862 [Tanacetum coccineum]|uniref:Uncharacterized protein n=1 Tax=Tanacetum coccineum TaxID=301880 RepID=A0ABQ4XSG5_9ASTR